jgi:hypothetical protein
LLLRNRNSKDYWEEKSLPTKKIRALGAFNIAKQPRDCSKTLAVLH